MSTRPTRRLAPVVALVALTLVAVPAIAPDAASAASPHRAAVIVETGDGAAHRVVIHFTEDSITGIDALSRAGADPVVYAFNGVGGAVCRLFGVGRDSGPDCLGGQDGDNRYWAYFRAPAGTSAFTYSSVGAGSTQVHDGDVEGWRFGTGQAPQFVPLSTLAPPPTPPATQPRGGGSSPAATGANGAPATGAGAATNPTGAALAPTTSSTLPVTGATGPTGAAAATGKRDGAATARENSDGKSSKRSENTDTALAASTHDDGGGSGLSLVWFALLLVAIVVAVLLIRRTRRRPVP